MKMLHLAKRTDRTHTRGIEPLSVEAEIAISERKVVNQRPIRRPVWVTSVVQCNRYPLLARSWESVERDPNSVVRWRNSERRWPANSPLEVNSDHSGSRIGSFEGAIFTLQVHLAPVDNCDFPVVALDERQLPVPRAAERLDTLFTCSWLGSGDSPRFLSGTPPSLPDHLQFARRPSPPKACPRQEHAMAS